MKTNNLFNELKSKTEKHVKFFKTDFEHDQKAIIENNGKLFLHVTREHGTNLTTFYNSKDFPKANERVNYLFGTADRKEILESNFDGLKYYLKNEPKSIHFYNGKQLKKVTVLEAENIYKKYYTSMLNKWREEEDIFNYYNL